MEEKPNIKTVAKLAGVSISTVSRVLNHSTTVSDELKEKVRQAIKETSYSANPIASTLKSARRNQIAIVVPSLRQTYFTDIIKGISDYCYKRQVTPAIVETSSDMEKERSIISNLEKQWVDGIILIPSKSKAHRDYKDYIALLSSLSKKEQRIPVVLAETDDFDNELDCVSVDYQYAFSSITYHLLEIGRRNIAFLCCPQDAPMYVPCLDGFREAVNEYGARWDENLIEDGGYTVLDGYHAMNRLFDREVHLDGVVCSNDQVASGALQACNERNIAVPQAIAVIGFGGVALSIVTTPSISTMISPRYEIGSKAAKILFERIDGDCEAPKKVVLRPHLAIRGSTLKTAFKTVDVMFAE